MSGSFLPKPFSHSYEIDTKFSKSAVYFSCEFAIDQIFKIYSGGLGFLAGSHMRSAAALRRSCITKNSIAAPTVSNERTNWP